MVRFYVRMAELVISVSAMYEETKQFCKDYLLEDVSNNMDIEVNVTTEDILRERKILEKSNGERCSGKYLEKLVVLRQMAKFISSYVLSVKCQNMHDATETIDKTNMLM